MGAMQTQLFLPSAAILRSMATLRHLRKEHLANSIRQQTFSSIALIVRELSENLQAVFLLSVNARSRFFKIIAVGLKTEVHFCKSKHKSNPQNELLVCTGTKIRQFKTSMTISGKALVKTQVQTLSLLGLVLESLAGILAVAVFF